MMARWLLLRRIAGRGKTGRPPLALTPTRAFLEGETRGRRIQRHTVKPAVWGRRQGKRRHQRSTAWEIDSRTRPGQVPGGTKGPQGDKQGKKATIYVGAARQRKWDVKERKPPSESVGAWSNGTLPLELGAWSLELGARMV